MFVVFTSTVEVCISAVYMGGVPLAEHDSMPSCIANRAAGNVTTGGTNSLVIKIFYSCCLLTDPYLLTLILNKSHLTVIESQITSLFYNWDPETDVCYLLRDCSLMGVSIIQVIIGGCKETMITGKVQLPCRIDVFIWVSFSATS